MSTKVRRMLAFLSVILFCTFLSSEFIIMEPWDIFPQIQEEYNASDLADEHLQPGANPEGVRLPATRNGRTSLRHSGNSAVFPLFFLFVPGEFLMERARRTFMVRLRACPLSFPRFLWDLFVRQEKDGKKRNPAF